jgi:hypothetical protein
MKRFGGGFFAPVCNEDPCVLWHFARVDTGERFPFWSLEHEVYLRTFRGF